MRRWITAFAGLLLGACSPNYAGPMTASSGHVVGASPYAYGAASPYGYGATPWSSPYGFNSGYGGANRFSPEKGLTCDRSRKICYDRYGVDYFETQKYLGSKSAKYGAKRYGEQVFIFAPQQGVVCDRRSQSCSDSGGLNATLTRKYFSKDDTRRVGAWTNADMFSPQAGVACNRTTRICSDNGGPNVNLTTLYLGQQAGLDLANQQNQPAPLAVPANAPDTQDPVPTAASELVDLPQSLAASAENEVLPPHTLDPVPETQVLLPDPLPAVEPVVEPTQVVEPVSAPEPVFVPEPGPAMAPEPAPEPAPAVTQEPAPAAVCEGENCP
ncbi:MAG: hypothetical protein IPK59_04575 [Rhodospirillaceae bacterium]|nr:hypothetical protein [Rhodospirillaceae bacterium]